MFRAFGRLVVPSPLLVAMLACTASQPGTREDRRASALARPASNTAVIQGDELQMYAGASAYDVVRRQRPAFLRERGLRTATVMVDLMPVGGLETLRDIPAESVAEIRYLDGISSSLIYGSRYSGGLILIRTARAGR